MVEKPRWLRRVLRTVGLMGEGEMGVRGRGERAAEWETAAAVLRVGTARASLGRAARASILIVVVVVGGLIDLINMLTMEMSMDS